MKEMNSMKHKSFLSFAVILTIILSVCAVAFSVPVSAASYPKIPSFNIARVRQTNEAAAADMCYWCSMSTVQGYCMGSYTYGSVTTNYRKAGTDYNYASNADAMTKKLKTFSGYANNAKNLSSYPVPMTLVTKDIGKNAYTYGLIYNQLAQGKPVIVYTGTHASVVIGYNGSSTTLDPAGFTVLEIKKDGNWWQNSSSLYNKYANSPQKDTNTGSEMSCYVTLSSWISYCGNKIQEICYPTAAVTGSYNMKFNANGGTGSMSGTTVGSGANYTVPACGFTYDGYTCAGYNVYRSSDGKWYTTDGGWATYNEVIDNNYSRKLYTIGTTYTIDQSWTKGVTAGSDFTFYPVWMPKKPALRFFLNSSGNNYLMKIDPVNFTQYYSTRDTSVYSLSTEGETLKIVGAAQGASGKDLSLCTQTNNGLWEAGKAYDNKNMTLSFRAKASVDGAKLYVRWGYSNGFKSVTLSTEWQTYSVSLPKNSYCGNYIHAYFDKAGTFRISDLALVDAGVTQAGEEEEYLYATVEYTAGTTYSKLPQAPDRDGYKFTGWYTSKVGGTQIAESTAVLSLTTNVYARYEKISGTLLGDADLSERIDIKDATIIQKYTAHMVNLSQNAMIAADVNSDDDVNIKDATAIQKCISEMETGYKIGEYI